MAETNQTAPAVFLTELRAQTRPQHEALEQIPESKILTDESLTDAEYANYLSRLYPVIKAFESQIFPIVQHLVPDIETRRKEPVLQQDLAQLGVNSKELPDYRFDTERITASEAMGMFYVIEGSTLGGKFIAGNIRKALGRGPENGARYFSIYGDSLGSKWKYFLEIFVKFVEDTHAGAAAITGARFMFDDMKDWMQKN